MGFLFVLSFSYLQYIVHAIREVLSGIIHKTSRVDTFKQLNTKFGTRFSHGDGFCRYNLLWYNAQIHYSYAISVLSGVLHQKSQYLKTPLSLHRACMRKTTVIFTDKEGRAFSPMPAIGAV